MLHGTRLTGQATGAARTAVIIEVARPPELAPLLLQAYGLSRREREVVRLVLTGLDTAGIAAALFVSPLTVQDHLKAVFAKTGVRSRRELVALLLGETGFFRSDPGGEAGANGRPVGASETAGRLGRNAYSPPV